MNFLKKSALIVSFMGLFCAASAGASTQSLVSFNPGTYFLASDYGQSPTETLFVAVLGDNAVFSLFGAVNASFVLKNNSVLSGDVDSPVFDASSLLFASWDTGLYTKVGFWSESLTGGLTIGNGDLSDSGGDFLADLYASDTGPGQVYSIMAVPEPETYALMLGGLALVGFVARRKAIA